MTTIKQVCLGVAVAGAVAGGGTAIATAVAYADTTEAAASTGSATNAGPASHTRTRGQAVKPAAATQRTRSAAAKNVSAPAVPAAAVQRSVPSTAVVGPRRRAAVVAAVTAPAVDAPVHVLLIGTDGTNLSKVLADPANTGFTDLMAQSVTGALSSATPPSPDRPGRRFSPGRGTPRPG